MIFFTFKVLLILASAFTTYVSFVLLISPPKFKALEKFLQQEFGGVQPVTTLEGEINFVNDWVFRNRYFFGPLFVILSAMNTWNAFFL